MEIFFVRNWYQIEQSCSTNFSDTFPNNIPSFDFFSKWEALKHVHVVVRASDTTSVGAWDKQVVQHQPRSHF